MRKRVARVLPRVVVQQDNLGAVNILTSHLGMNQTSTVFCFCSLAPSVVQLPVPMPVFLVSLRRKTNTHFDFHVTQIHTTASTCIAPYLPAWRRVTSNTWVLSIIATRYAIEFNTLPPPPISIPTRGDCFPSPKRYYRGGSHSRHFPRLVFLLFHCPKERL